MSGNIWKWDQYDLRRFYPGSTDYFLDIGGCVGTTSVLFKAIDPWAQVIACEPCKEDFEIMKVVAGQWDVRCYNVALGNGEQLCFGRKKQGAHRFYTSDEKKWWPETPEYLVPSMTLPQMFKKFNIKGRYNIKVDCEGGERFLLDDEEAIEIIRGCVQFNMEYHPGFDHTHEEWNRWFSKFFDTHTMRSRNGKNEGRRAVFEEIDHVRETWRSEYVLARKA